MNWTYATIPGGIYNVIYCSGETIEKAVLEARLSDRWLVIGKKATASTDRPARLANKNSNPLFFLSRSVFMGISSVS
jgi:hypothetical protein